MLSASSSSTFFVIWAFKIKNPPYQKSISYLTSLENHEAGGPYAISQQLITFMPKPGTLSATLSVADLKVGATTNYLFTIVKENFLKADSNFVFVFPTDIDVSNIQFLFIKFEKNYFVLCVAVLNI